MEIREKRKWATPLYTGPFQSGLIKPEEFYSKLLGYSVPPIVAIKIGKQKSNPSRMVYPSDFTQIENSLSFDL